ncbi:MAG: hypothetical protein JSV42_01190 [Chloroflexota bacterium]|nr:MAG: hypothetical protein JSV42_01190 [Chloroflexota bacterium]
MANIYGAYHVKSADAIGTEPKQEMSMKRIEDHSILKSLVQESPEKIWIEVINPGSADEPFEGFLVNAPRDKSYFIELVDVDYEAIKKLGAAAPNHIAEFGPPKRTWNTIVHWWEGTSQWKTG